MIKEDFCSYEVSKLLKEKGFPVIEHLFMYVNKDNVFMTDHYACLKLPWEEYKDFDEIYTPTITHQMAMKWLREEHDIDIIPVIRHSLKYAQENPFRDYACRVYDVDGNIVMSTTKWYSKYERAIEAALKYCLEKIIK